MTIGEAMRAAREKAGLSRNKLARMTGIPTVYLYRYENGESLPKVDTAEMLADTLGISVDEYIGHKVREKDT